MLCQMNQQEKSGSLPHMLLDCKWSSFWLFAILLASNSTERLRRKTFKRPPTCLKPRVERSGANWWWCQCTRVVHQSESVVGSQSPHQQHLVLLFFTLLPFYFSAEQSNFIPASAIFWNPLSSRQTQLRWWWECLLWRVRTIWQSDNLRTINNQREHFADHQRCFLPPHHHLRHCRYVARWWVCGQREIIIAWQGRLPILLPIEDLKIDILMQRTWELNAKLYFHSNLWKICSN